MPRPKNKAQLEDLSSLNFKKLVDFINSMDPSEQETEFPESTMNRNKRDVLALLYHWHLMMMRWYELGMQGIRPDMPALGYTWKTAPEMNRTIWKDIVIHS